MSGHVGRVDAMNLFEMWIGECRQWWSGAVWEPAPQRKVFRCPTPPMPTPSSRPELARLIVEDNWSVPRAAERCDVSRRAVIDDHSRVACVEVRDDPTRGDGRRSLAQCCGPVPWARRHRPSGSTP